MQKSVARIDRTSDGRMSHRSDSSARPRVVSSAAGPARNSESNRLRALLDEIDELKTDVTGGTRGHDFNTGLYTGIELCRDIIKEHVIKASAPESRE